MLLNIKQVAESLGVSERKVEDWIRREGLPVVPDRGRLVFHRDEVADWAATHGLAAQTGFLTREEVHIDIAMLLSKGGIWRNVAVNAIPSTIGKAVDNMPGISTQIKMMLKSRISSEGGLTWAPVGRGFALPHLTTRVALGRDCGFVALLKLDEPLDLVTPPDMKPVKNLFFFLAPSPRTHLEILSGFSRILSQKTSCEIICSDADDQGILSALGGAGPVDSKISE